MAISVVEFSHGLAVPFMELSIGKRWWQPRETWKQAERLVGKIERNHERSENMQRAKRALQKAAYRPAVHGALGRQEVGAAARRLGNKQRGRAEWPENVQRASKRALQKAA